MVLATEQIAKMGKKSPLAAIQFPETIMALTWPKQSQKHPKIVGLFSHSLALPKNDFQLGKQWENAPKLWGRKPSH